MMNTNISAWAIRNPIPVILLFVLMTFLGLASFSDMKIQGFPDVEEPTIVVAASLPGASPSQMETEVARRIENAVATAQGVKNIETRITDGEANIEVEFRLEKPLQEALDDVRDAVSRVRADLPADLLEPVIRKADFTGSPILTYAIDSARMDDQALSWFVDNTVGKALLAVRGVGSVARVGGVQRAVRVDLDPDRLLALRASAADISRQLRQVQQDASGGRMDLGGSEQGVRTIATVQTAEAMGAIELLIDGNRRVRLDQIATVTDAADEPRSAALLDGTPVVGFEVTRARGHGEVDVARGVREALATLQRAHPGITVTETFNFVEPVVENYQGSMRLLYEGAALAVLVVWLFLRNARATFVAAVALPLSVIPSFALMHMMDFTLNIVTLLSLSLVVGVLVDDAIVEIENVERHLLMGKSAYAAAMDASAEIGLAVVATTFTLIAVFLPTAFMGGTIGKFFVQFGWTAAIAVFFSLVVARLLTPMMAAYLLRTPSQRARAEPRWLQHHQRWVRWCLHHRAITLSAAAAFFAGGLWIAMALPATFIPPDDDPQTQVTVTLEPGSDLRETQAMAERARVLLMRHPHVHGIYTTIGGGSTGADPNDPSSAAASNVRTAVLTLRLSHRNDRAGLPKSALEADLREALAVLPGARIQVGMGGMSEGYELALSSDDSRLLEQHALQVARELRTIPGIGAVTTSANLASPELRVRPDFARAADLGITSAMIAETVRVATVGDQAHALAQLNLNERQVPVLVRLRDAARTDVQVLRQLPVIGTNGPVALENVASIEFGSGPSEIQRLNRMRTVTIDAQLNGMALGDVERAALALPSLHQLPPGISHSSQGDAEEMAELATGFGIAMLTGVLCIYLVLVLLLKDFVQPGTILTALVLSVPGAMLALFLTGSALSMPSMIGLIMLMGISTKNSILLVDYIIIARQAHGLDRMAAILDACHKRAKPIVMTTVAMGAGMLPVAIGLGADPSFRAPMAIVVIGGLISSTALSLLVVPVVYHCVDDAVQWVSRRLGLRRLASGHHVHATGSLESS